MMKWYKRDPDAALIGFRGLTHDEKSAYGTIIDLAYSRNGDVPFDDEHFWCVHIECRPQWWRRVRTGLIAKGKIRNIDGKLVANRVETTLKEAANLGQTQVSRGGLDVVSLKKANKNNGISVPRARARAGDNHNHNQIEDGADAPLPDKAKAEKELFERGKQVLGQKAGGLIRKVLKAKGENVALARAAIEQASTKQSPVEYIGRIAAGPPDDKPPDIAERTNQAGFYAQLDSPEQRAWEQYRGKSPRDRDGGWIYPSQWPPMPTPAEKLKAELMAGLE